jgi:putrescine transport system substrate-binding protein
MRLSLIAAALGTCLLTACGKSADPAPAAAGTGPAATPAAAPAEPAKLNVYNWSDYIAEDTIARFEQATGIDVTYDVYADNETLEAKLIAGGSGYDVIFPSARPFAARHIAAGLYLPLDKSKLGSWGNLDPRILASLTDADPGNTHLMPYMWGTTGIGWNVAKVRERLGADFTVDSWAVLFDPANAEKLKDCGITILDDEQEAFYAALMYLGRDPNGVGGGEIDAVRELYAKVRPFIRDFDSGSVIDNLANGEICVAMGYNGDVLQARNRAAEAGNGVEIAYAIPKEGAVRWQDSAAIPKDAPHPNNAHRFIEFLLQPDVIAPVSNYVSYANANLASKPLVDEAIRNDPGVYPSDEIMAKLIDPKKLPDDENRERQRAWTSIKTGR